MIMCASCEKNGLRKTHEDKAKPPKACLERSAEFRGIQARASSKKRGWGLPGYTLQNKRRVESAREAETERGKLGAGRQVLCKSASLSGVTSAERLSQQLTKGTRLRIASFSLWLRCQTGKTCRKGQIQVFKRVKSPCRFPLTHQIGPGFLCLVP